MSNRYSSLLQTTVFTVLFFTFFSCPSVAIESFHAQSLIDEFLNSNMYIDRPSHVIQFVVLVNFPFLFQLIRHLLIQKCYNGCTPTGSLPLQNFGIMWKLVEIISHLHIAVMSQVGTESLLNQGFFIVSFKSPNQFCIHQQVWSVICE